MRSRLYFYYGCMSSSKTLRLLTMAHGFEEKGMDTVLFKPAKDTRDGEDVIRSRVGIEKPCVVIDDDTDLFKAIGDYYEYLSEQGRKLRWVMIDECQFLEERQIDELARVVDELGVNVMCFGLRTDFRTRLFPASKRLFEIADKIEEIGTYCECGESKAIVNARIGEDGKFETEGSQVLVGGDDRYVSVCRKCWKEKLSDK